MNNPPFSTMTNHALPFLPIKLVPMGRIVPMLTTFNEKFVNKSDAPLELQSYIVSICCSSMTGHEILSIVTKLMQDAMKRSSSFIAFTF
jgi:hypothetical protein